MILEKIKQASAVELISIIPPVLILIGLINKIGIYTSSQVDANWLISLFSPIDFMVSNIEVYFYFFLSILYLEKVFFSRTHSFFIEVLGANATLFSTFASLAIISYFKYQNIEFSINFYIYSLLSLNGFIIIYRAKNLLKLIGIIALLFVPYKLGVTQAQKVSDDNLPTVELNDHKKWYLLDKYTDKAILINKDGFSNKFKIVEMKDINSIKR